MGKSGKKFEEFIKIVKKLRKKCPWDRVQTLKSLKPFLVEEVYEAIQAIDDEDHNRLADEIGDMLLHVVMLSVILSEESKFSVADIIDIIKRKMIKRHPHVFGGEKLKTAEEVLARWARVKQGEKKAGILASIPPSLPALYRAEKVQKRAARVGFDWDQVAGAWEKVHEEMDEVHELLKVESRKSKVVSRKIEEEIGDLLFAITNVARKLEINAEQALQYANAKFMRRFSKIEKKLSAGGKKMTLAQMDHLWNKVKASEI